MTSRRQFIRSGLAISALSLTEPAVLRAARAGETADVPLLDDFVYDRRFPESIEVAREMGLKGITLREIEGDITDLWYEFYSEQWRQKPMTLAGVTASDALFVLETLACDHGMRVIHKAEQPREQSHGADNESLYSWVIAPRRQC